MLSAWWGRSLLKHSMKSSNLACCRRQLRPAGLVVSSFRVRCMRSWRPFCGSFKLNEFLRPRRARTDFALHRARHLRNYRGVPFNLVEKLTAVYAAFYVSLFVILKC